MIKLTVVKIGGNVVDDELKLKSFLDQFVALDGKKILVHGGGKLATELARQLNIPVNMHEGRRITDAETLKIAAMVYAGYINKNIVALLQGSGCNAMGLSGADGNCIKTKKRDNKEIDFGFVGDVYENSVNVDFLSRMIEESLVPVVSPITHDNYGQLLNTNADTIASATAVAMSDFYSVDLVYCFEKKGVLQDVRDEKSVIPEINNAKYNKLKEEGVIADGMIPKLDNSFDAIKSGVSSVRIGKAEDLSELTKQNPSEGTRLYA